MTHVPAVAVPTDERERGQSLVEFAAALPVLALLLLGMLDLGFAFNHHLSLEYSTREGARMGSALGPGTATVPCSEVDPRIIAAVQRVLTSPGSQIDLNQVTEIRIYKAGTNGDQIGSQANIWTLGAGPVLMTSENASPRSSRTPGAGSDRMTTPSWTVSFGSVV